MERAIRAASKLRRQCLHYALSKRLIQSESGWKNSRLFRLVREHLGDIGGDLTQALDMVLTQMQPMPKKKVRSGSSCRPVPPMQASRGPLAPPKNYAKRWERVPDKEFFESREWKRLRYEALLLHGAKCLCCGASRADGKQIHVDHIKPRSAFPQLQWDISNLQVLCEDCNLGKGAWDYTDWRDTREDWALN